MKMTESVFIVYGQDTEGNNAYPYYFTNAIHACTFAVKNTGLIAYGLPSVTLKATTYDTDNLNYKKVETTSHRYSEEEIRKIAADDGSGKYGRRYVK